MQERCLGVPLLAGDSISESILLCSHDNFMFMADGWKMDYGGHDSKFRDNIVYHGTGSFHGGNDGQNCVNAWPMVPGHGCEWTGNKCVLPKSNNLFGLIAGGCDCPGPAFPAKRFNASDPTGQGPQSECGVKFGHNEYFTHNGSGTANQCGDFDSDWKGKNEPDSKIDTLPTDDELLSWAREKLDM